MRMFKHYIMSGHNSFKNEVSLRLFIPMITLLHASTYSRVLAG